VWFPGAFAAFARLLDVLPAQSRLRRAMLRRAAERGCEAYNRRDFAAYVLYYRPDIEEIVPRQLVAIGFDPVYRGRQEGLRYRLQWAEEWGEFQLKPEELFDLGDKRMLLMTRAEGRSPSGVALAHAWCFLCTLSASGVSRQELFFDRGEAFRAAGLEG
jgi:hypothetical protein